MPKTIYIPDTLRNWPWQRAVNPNYEICKAESAAWAESFGAFSPKAQKAFNKCDFNLLASMAFSKLNKDGCRVGCDLMNLFFVFDEWSDVSDAVETRKLADIIMDALRNPHKPRPQDEWVGGEVTRQYWANAIRTATPSAQRRFVNAFDGYTASVVQQSADRDQNHIRTIESYFDVRRDTIGAKPSFAVNELHMNIPDYVMENEVIKRLHAGCIDMLCIGNDLCSYNVEQARGDDLHNLVTIVMHQLQLDVQGAFDWIGKLHDQLVDKFLDDYRKVVARYVDDLGNWVRANDQWSFESQRYFGKDGLRVLSERTIEQLPKQGYSSVKPDKQGVGILSDFEDYAGRVFKGTRTAAWALGLMASVGAVVLLY
ncbi:terpenoid synthase [Cyathus striatus]|nr:terpenoid synthase [Cyathus striatus]